MEMIIDFPSGSRVDAHFGPFTITTDQQPDSSAPSPFATFLASIGTCAGIYVLGFCQQRNLSTEGVRLVQTMEVNQMSGMVEKIDLDIQVPLAFPEEYKSELVYSANQCAVKKHLETPPKIEVKTSTMKIVA